MEVVDYKYCEHPTANEKKLGLMVTKRHEKVVLHADSKSLGCNFVCQQTTQLEISQDFKNQRCTGGLEI